MINIKAEQLLVTWGNLLSEIKHKPDACTFVNNSGIFPDTKAHESTAISILLQPMQQNNIHTPGFVCV